jgi:endonuclease YncB( thermonuclease family)
MPNLLALLLLTMPLVVSAKWLDCPCKVVKITDGDTVHVLDQLKARSKIRLGGIDAPERKQAYGRRSKENLARLIAGKLVTVEYHKRDRYGRIIGKIYLNYRDINLQQIADGYAWHYKHYQKDQTKTDRALYAKAEKKARLKRLGLWVSASFTPPWEYRQNKRK